MDEILTSEIVAKKLGITSMRVRQLIKELGLKPRSIGKAHVFSSDDLLKMSERNKRRGGRRVTA